LKIRIWLSLLTLVSVLPVFAELLQVAPAENSIRVLSSTQTETILQYEIGRINSSPVRIGDEIYHSLSLPSEGIAEERGCPMLPVLHRSLIIPPAAAMNLELTDLQYVDLPMRVAPSKGALSRDIDPASVPWEFGDSYSAEGFYPSVIATLSEPYILRDFRGITIRTSPVVYNHSNQTVRIYSSFKLRVYASGSDSRNRLNRTVSSLNQSFLNVYQNHFLNFEPGRYVPVDESFGKLLVISTNQFLTDVNLYVNWKKQKGIPTELVMMSAVGTTAAQLQAYLQARYTADPDIAYVQLMGDHNLIPSPLVSGGGSDPSYSLVSGTDSYPDIFIGRFSAQTQAQLATQVSRSIVYERDLNGTATWLSRGMGIASAEGGGSTGDDGESDIVHMNGIRTDLLNFGYSSVDQIYDPGATDSQVSTNLNAGRGWLSYTGHGSTTSWGTTGFDTTDALNLSNDHKLPVIVDVACQNGNFTGSTNSFAEAWMQSSHGTNGNPTGAIAIYASSINQSWNAPMSAQDEVVDLMVQGLSSTVGGLFFNGACKMMDEYGTDGISMFKTWNIFGDASLVVRTKTPQSMTVSHPQQIQTGTNTIQVNTNAPGARVALTFSNTIIATGISNASGACTLNLQNQPLEALCYTLTVTAKDRVTYSSGIQQVMDLGPCMRASAFVYDDLNNDQPDYNESGFLNVTFTNSGATAGQNILASLSSSSPGLVFTDSTELISYVAAGASVLVPAAFGISLADGIANGSQLQFTLTMTNGVNNWVQNFGLIANAPVLSFGPIVIIDPMGNNNGTLDPGETATLNVTILNNGGAASASGLASLNFQTPGLNISPLNIPFDSVNSGSSRILSIGICADADLQPGTVSVLTLTATAGSYTCNRISSLGIGTPHLVTIGTGSSTQSYPLDRFYNYSTHESIYLASEIGSAGIIQSLGFEKAAGQDLNSISNVTIFMKHTTATTLATGTYNSANYVQVFSGSFPNNPSGWMEINLTNRFTYDGLSNLSILIVKGFQTWTYDYPQWKSSIESVNRSRQNRNDDAQPTQLTATTLRPNLRFNIFNLNLVPQPVLSLAGGMPRLSWNAVSGAQSYRILASDSPDETFLQIGRTSATSFIPPATGSNQRYFKVIASSEPM